MGDSISDIKSTENIPPNSCTTEGDVLSMKITNDFQELFSKVQSLRNLIFGLKEENIVSTAESIMNIGEINYPFSYGLVLSQLIYSAFISQKKDFNIYLQLMLEIGEKEEACEHKLIDIFKFFIFSFFPKHAECQETNYILEQLIEHNYLNPKDLPIGSLYFIQYQANKVSLFDNFSPFKNYFLHNINKLKKDNWALHKKYVKEGINPNEIAKAIRYDNVENLQELASQTNFDFNQTIEPSLYERFSYINQRDVSLIDYAAFFGSIKCFKFLMLNGSDLNNIVLNDNFPTDNLSSTCLYAIAGGNNQIIHFCEESHIPFNGSLEIAIKFHQNDIFYYIYENKLTEINDLSLLGKECIKYYNLEIFLFLLKEGMKLSTSIIEDVAKIGNIFIIKSLIEENQIPKTILIYSSISGNIELVKLILEQKGIDINEKKFNFYY